MATVENQKQEPLPALFRNRLAVAAILSAIMLAALALRVFPITDRCLWFDEACSWRLSSSRSQR